MNKGTVKFFNEVKGFGFIKDNDSPKEYFVHSSGLQESIQENDEVEFDLQEGKKRFECRQCTTGLRTF